MFPAHHCHFYFKDTYFLNSNDSGIAISSGAVASALASAVTPAVAVTVAVAVDDPAQEFLFNLTDYCVELTIQIYYIYYPYIFLFILKLYKIIKVKGLGNFI